jgi:AcrR family transcriptional regulator
MVNFAKKMVYMPKRKGELSQLWLIENCINVFNTKGLDITLNQLAVELNISLGRISYYYPTKEKLLVAISLDYENKLTEITTNFQYSTDQNFLLDQFRLYSQIMDNQYHYRCVMIYASGASNSRKEMINQINVRYRGSSERFRLLIDHLIELGFLDSKLLDYPGFEVFRFKFITVFTTWVINLEIYDKEQGYEKMKPIYLQGIASCFLPFATPKAKKILQEIDYTTL